MYKLLIILPIIAMSSCSTPCALQNQAKTEKYLSDFGEVNTPKFFKSWRNCNAQAPTPESIADKERREAMLPSYVVSNGKRYRLQSPFLEQDKFQTWRPKKLQSYKEAEAEIILEEPHNHNHPHNNHNHNVEDPINLDVE